MTAKLPYRLWKCAFPVRLLKIKPASADGSPDWAMRLLADIRDKGLRNPIVVDGHSLLHDQFLVMVGNNRHWAARQLGWESIPAIVSYPRGLPFRPVRDAIEVDPAKLQDEFQDGVAYATLAGWGVHSAVIPEVEFKD